MKGARFATSLACGMLLVVQAAQLQAESPDFLRDVAPVLKKYCAGCHNDADHEGDFSVESFASLQRGVGDGPAFLASDAAGSRMIRVLTGAEPQMPPQDEPQPSADEIAILSRWIDSGAKGPEGVEPDRLMLVVPKIESRAEQRPVTSLTHSPASHKTAVARFGEVALLAAPFSPESSKSPTLVLRDFPGRVNNVNFNADGTLLLTASGVEGLGGVAALWNTADGTLVREFKAHKDVLYDAELSPDGATVATCSYDKLITLWDAQTGTPLRTLDGHNGAVYDVAFSPDGQFLVSASADDTCKVWRVRDGERLDTLGQPLGEQFTCTFSPDGRTIVAGGADNRIRVWKFISTDRPRINPLLHARFAHEGGVLRVQFTADGSRLVSLADDRTIKLWDTREFKELHLWDEQPDVASALAIDEAARSFLVGRLDGSLEAYPLSAGIDDVSKPAAASAAGVTVSNPISDTALISTMEREPNDSPAEATMIQVPAQVAGVIHRDNTAAGESSQNASISPDFDLFRFAAKTGEEWVIDIEADRSKSPLDSYVEVLAHDGERIERVLLQAVRDSYFTFRGKDANQIGDFRLFNWEEMTLNELLYCNGEVVKLWMYPRGPDSGYNVYPGQGTRWGYFDTTPLAHALGEPCFIVQPFAPGSTLIPNGLPVFTLYYENDDESRRTQGKDSRLTFTAPADGEYLIKVKDVRGNQGPDYKYTLRVRRRQPDFKVALAESSLTVAPGSTREFRVRADRLDDFEGPIQVDLTGLPEGFSSSCPLMIEAGQIEAMGVISANAHAATLTEEQLRSVTMSATAALGSEDVTHPVDGFKEIKVGDPPKLLARIVPAEGGVKPAAAPSDGPLEFVIHPGETIMLKVVVERNGFDGEVSFGNAESGRNLPHGLYVDNIGLNGLLLLSDQSEREFFVTADHWVPEQSRLFHLMTGIDGGHATPPVLLHVKRNGSNSEQASRE